MTLNFGRANETYRVEALDLPPKVAKRLEALGMAASSSIIQKSLLSGSFI